MLEYRGPEQVVLHQWYTVKHQRFIKKWFFPGISFPCNKSHKVTPISVLIYLCVNEVWRLSALQSDHTESGYTTFDFDWSWPPICIIHTRHNHLYTQRGAPLCSANMTSQPSRLPKRQCFCQWSNFDLLYSYFNYMCRIIKDALDSSILLQSCDHFLFCLFSWVCACRDSFYDKVLKCIFFVLNFYSFT